MIDDDIDIRIRYLYYATHTGHYAADISFSLSFSVLHFQPPQLNIVREMITIAIDSRATQRLMRDITSLFTFSAAAAAAEMMKGTPFILHLANIATTIATPTLRHDIYLWDAMLFIRHAPLLSMKEHWD